MFVQHFPIANLSYNDFPMNSPITEDKPDNLLFSANEIQNAKDFILEFSNVKGFVETDCRPKLKPLKFANHTIELIFNILTFIPLNSNGLDQGSQTEVDQNASFQ